MPRTDLAKAAGRAYIAAVKREAVNAALDALATKVEGLPVVSGSHWDQTWNDATGAQDHFHECGGFDRAAVLTLIKEARR